MAILVILSCLGIFCMLVGLFEVNIKVVLGVSVLALLVCLGSIAISWGTEETYFNDMVFFDNYALGFSASLITCTILLILLSQPFLDNVKGFIPEHFAMMFFALTGMVCMVCFDHMSMLFIGIEIMSVSLYVLAGSNKSSLASNEASLKYFLMGAFSTGFILMGITLIYAETSSFHLNDIKLYLEEGNAISPLLPLGISLILMGLLFKVSAVPFHFWTPDVYEGSPDYITAFMSAVAKAASLGAFYRLFEVCFGNNVSNWSNMLGVIAALTITIGSLGAVYQYNIKRLLAYSSIANAGFMLIAIMLSGTTASSGNMLFYASAYAIAVISAFGVIMVVSNKTGSDSIDSFNGLLKTSPLMSVVMTISMLSLAGIPLTAGFFGKFFILYSAMSEGYIWLTILAIINSMIGIYYYFKVIIAMNFKSPSNGEVYQITGMHQFALLAGTAITLVLGIFPQLMYQLLD